MNFDKFTLVAFILLSNLITSQETIADTTALPYLQKAEFSLLSLGLIMNFRYLKCCLWIRGSVFLLVHILPKDEVRFQKNLLNPTFYLKSELKYYYNRYVRVAKNYPHLMERKLFCTSK